jgi:hypothetical protein
LSKKDLMDHEEVDGSWKLMDYEEEDKFDP